MIKLSTKNLAIKSIYILAMLGLGAMSCFYLSGEAHQYIELAVSTVCIIIAGVLLFVDITNVKPNVIRNIGIGVFVVMAYIILFAVLKNGLIEKFKFIAINVCMILSICLVALAITRRSAVALSLVIAVGLFITIANEEVMSTRGTPILPTDIWALGTATEVADGYKFCLSFDILNACASSLALFVIAGKFEFVLSKNTVGLWLRGMCVLTSCVCLFVTFGNIKKANKSFSFSGFNISNANKEVGVLATFAANTRDMRITEPEEYVAEKCSEAMGETQYEATEKYPNVVVIMNEAFSDLNSTYGIETNIEPLEFFNSLEENTVRGTMISSVFGGNTSFSEFEFLTGMSNGIFNANITPYTQCVKGNINTLCSDFKNAGFAKIAVHPFWGKCWNRKYVYPLLGFDKAIFAEDFDENFEGDLEMGNNIMGKADFGDFEYVRNYMSDGESYKKVIEEFENKAEGERKFIFNVTIQNHGGYAYSGADFENTVNAENIDDDKIDQYLTLIDKSDDAYKELIEYFENQDEPVVVLMFGDHQPNLKLEDDFYNKYEENAKYEVPFLLWANYDIEEEHYDKISANYLSLLVKKAAGMPYTGWDNVRAELMEKYPVLNMNCAYTKDGEWISVEDINDEVYKLYQNMEYYLFFDRG